MSGTRQKGLGVQRSVEARTKEGKGKEYAYTDRFERMQKIEGGQRCESQFPEDLQTLPLEQSVLSSSSTGLKKIKDQKISIKWPLSSLSTSTTSRPTIILVLSTVS